MRYFLTFLFFILFASDAYATDPASLPNDPWMKNFWGDCGYHSIKHHENNNVFWRFTLERGDRGVAVLIQTIMRGPTYLWREKRFEVEN